MPKHTAFASGSPKCSVHERGLSLTDHLKKKAQEIPPPSLLELSPPPDLHALRWTIALQCCTMTYVTHVHSSANTLKLGLCK